MYKPVVAGVIAGLTTVTAVGAIIERREKKATAEKQKLNSSMQLTAELLEWLMLAPSRGYTDEQIRDHFALQSEFIDLIMQM